MKKKAFAALLALLLLVPSAGLAAFPYVRASCYPVYLACIAAGCDPQKTDMFLMPQGGYMEAYALSEPDLLRSQEADIVALLGGGLESFLNYLAQEGMKPMIVAGADVERIEGRILDPDEDTQPADNPYVWLSPARWGEVVHGVSAALCQLDPTNEGVYTAALAAAMEAVERVQTAMDEQLGFFAGRQVVVMHPALSYLALDAGLDVVLTVERDPGQQPYAGDEEALLELLAPYPDAVVLVEDTAPQMLLSLPGYDVAALDVLLTGPLSGDRTAWEDAMTHNIEVLADALSGAGGQ